MKTRPGAPAAAAGVDEEAVAAYLCEHPDFLARRGDVLAALELPHRPGGGAVSLIERQVAELRARNGRLEERLSELLATARENERLGARLVALGRGLLEADSLDAVVALVRDTLVNELAADEAAVHLIDDGDGCRAARAPERFVRSDDALVVAFADVLEQGRPVSGGLSDEQLAAVFGDGATAVASAAVVPLLGGRPLGLLALGSADPGHFRPDMGTLFLGQLGELVAAAVGHRVGAG